MDKECRADIAELALKNYDVRESFLRVGLIKDEGKCCHCEDDNVISIEGEWYCSCGVTFI